MKANLIYDIAHDTNETIVTASISAPDEYVLLMSSGEVIRHKFGEPTAEILFSIHSSFSYKDGGFDIEAPSTIYTLDDIVVVVNDYKRHGYIYYPAKHALIHLWREDYHADISAYPIALFRDQQGVPHIIYAQAWNHVQIMNIETKQVVTATKSLIEEFAEETYREHYKRFYYNDKLPWPPPYDYFYGRLQMSPDKSKFLSEGWAWGSYDVYNIYELDHFVNSPLIRDKNIGGWQHLNRGVCWVNDTCVAVAFHPVKDDDKDATPDSPCEIHFYKIDGNKAEIERKIKIPAIDILDAHLHYNISMNAFVSYADDIGVVVVSSEGNILFRDADMKVTGYDAEANLLLCAANKTVRVYQLSDHSDNK